MLETVGLAPGPSRLRAQRLEGREEALHVLGVNPLEGALAQQLLLRPSHHGARPAGEEQVAPVGAEHAPEVGRRLEDRPVERLAPAEHVSGLLALGDVQGHRGHADHLAAGGDERRVAPVAGDGSTALGDVLVDVPLAAAPVEQLAEDPVDVRAGTLRHDEVQGLPHRFRDRPAEDGLGGGVPGGDAELLVVLDDGHGRRLDMEAQPPLRLPPRLVGPGAVGDVDGSDQDADAVVEADRREPRLVPDLPPLLQEAAGGQADGLPGADLVVEPAKLGRRGREEVPDASPDRCLVPEAGGPQPLAVGPQDDAVDAQHAEPDAGRVEDLVEETGPCALRPGSRGPSGSLVWNPHAPACPR